MDLEYREHPTPAPLARHVRCMWSLRGVSSPAPQTIVPDGCPELLFNCADPVTQVASDGRTFVQPRLTLIGELRRPVTIGDGVHVDMVGVRLRPGALGVLFDEPPRRLVDGVVDLHAVVSVAERAALRAAVSEEDVSRRVGSIGRWLLQRLRRSTLDDRLVRRAVHLVEAAHGVTSVEHLAEDLGVERRSLERAFVRAVGISPKSFSRVRRFRRALALLDAGRRFTDVAAACGYFDQAHLIRDFRAYAGRTPSAYLASIRELDQLFGDDVSHLSNPR